MKKCDCDCHINGSIYCSRCFYRSKHKAIGAKELGSLGGQVKSEAKTKAARQNRKLGGRPKKVTS